MPETEIVDVGVRTSTYGTLTKGVGQIFERELEGPFRIIVRSYFFWKEENRENGEDEICEYVSAYLKKILQFLKILIMKNDYLFKIDSF